MNVLIIVDSLENAKAIAYGRRRKKAGDSVVFCPDPTTTEAEADEVVFPADWPTLEEDRKAWIAKEVTVTVLGVDAPKPEEKPADDDVEEQNPADH